MVLPRVMVVEDSAELRQLFARVLDRTAVEHVTVPDAASALAALDEQEFALVLLDKRLGASSGLEVLARLRADPRHRATRVVMMSGDPPGGRSGEGPEPDSYLMKPVGVHQLVDVVRTQLAAFDEAEPSEGP